MSLVLKPILNLPLIQGGDNLADLLISAMERASIPIRRGDIIAVTSKIVSKAENRFVNLADISPSNQAIELSQIHAKDTRLIELILRESRDIIRVNKQTMIVEHRLGFICANAGIDHSNVKHSKSNRDYWVLLLPADPEKSAREIRDQIQGYFGIEAGVIIIDSQGRPWRQGMAGMMIGTAGVPALVDLRGKKDLFGKPLRITQVAAADELAAAASLIMGQANEKAPAVHISGFPYTLRESSIAEILRPKDGDLFR